MLTFEDAKQLKPGDVLVDTVGRRWKVSGRVKLWKKPENMHRIRIPLKRGLYIYDALTEADFYVANSADANNERVCPGISHIEGR